MKLPISEIYPAIQGEGLHKTPAIFVRVWGCNLRCGWNQRKDDKTQCDTPYAVFEGKNSLMSIEDIVRKIKEEFEKKNFWRNKYQKIPNRAKNSAISPPLENFAHQKTNYAKFSKEYPFKHLVFTGGEPTLFQFTLIEIIKELSDYFIEVETNGTINLLKEFSERVNQFIVNALYFRTVFCVNYI